MILCATNQEGIDIVLPVCHVTQNLGPDSVTAIVIQVKNAKGYKAKIQGNLFDAMDSIVKTTIFSWPPKPEVDCDPDWDSESATETAAEPKKNKRKITKVTPTPERVKSKAVIRIVFALGSPEPAVVFKDRPEKMQDFDGLTTFDIWLAGLSGETFNQIQDGDLVHYQTLLERSLAPHDAFELKDVPQIGRKAKELRRARRQKMVPLTFTGRAHHRLHRVMESENPGEGSGGQPIVPIWPGTLDPQRARATRAITAGLSTIQLEHASSADSKRKRKKTG
jgi:hypothetical protein